MVAAAGVAALLLVMAGCGADRSGGPKGTPEAIVGNAPQRTLDARTARVEISGQHADASGVVDLGGGLAQLDIRPDRRGVLGGGGGPPAARGGGAGGPRPR